MAFDGYTIAAVRHELEDKLIRARVLKIIQPEPDELYITFKNDEGTLRLDISANPSLPLIFFTEERKEAPKEAPSFCMLLRKHLQNGRVLSVTQPGMERVLDIEIEHMDEMGDMTSRHLVAEFMGKHSNIILVNDEKVVLDSIKRIPGQVSSVREVLPGRQYFIPGADEKIDPYELTFNSFRKKIEAFPGEIYKALYLSVTGLSPMLANEVCERAEVDADTDVSAVAYDSMADLFNSLLEITSEVKKNDFKYGIYSDFEKLEFSVIALKHRKPSETFDCVSELITEYYREKDQRNRMSQKSSDLRKLVSTYLDRAYKKRGVQEKDIKKTENREKYRVYGELLQAYGYNTEPEAKEITVGNYYDDNRPVTIPLDPDLSPQENASAYFKKYNKLKRTFEAATLQLKETNDEIRNLESVAGALEFSETEDDLSQIKMELAELGYIKASGNDKKKQVASVPLKFISSDGFEIYVGKNNYQNEEVTFKIGAPDDWWFHAKNIPGSHVILKSGGKEVPDRAFEEAAAVAAHFSKAGGQKKVEVDYTLRKEIKKPPGGAPGFVIYHTNYSMVAGTDISGLHKV